MAKDIQDNNNMTSDNPDPENLSHVIDDIDAPSDGTMETRTQIFLDGQFKGEIGEPLVNKVETTTAKDGLVETTEIRLKTAQCGHLLHTASEAGLTCMSCLRQQRKEPSILCSECAKSPDNYCFICNSVCCWKCRDERRIDGKKRVVCKACIKTTLRRKLIKQIIKWLLIAAAIYYLIML